MSARKKIFAVCGSASDTSTNLAILDNIKELCKNKFDITIYNDLSTLPHFKPELTIENVPVRIQEFRNMVNSSDAVVICTPEYVFSIPSGLKNALEWCVSTVVLTDKPVGLITASASGEKGHEELKLIMSALQAKISDKANLLISGAKGKLNKEGKVLDEKTKTELTDFICSFSELIQSSESEQAFK